MSLPKDKNKIEDYFKKLSLSHLGQTAWNKGTIGLVKAWNKGKKMSKEHCQKLSFSHIGKIHSGSFKKGHGSLRSPEQYRNIEYIKKLSIAQGEKKGWVTPKNKLLRNSINYSDWRKAVFERDNFTCRDCGLRSGNGKAVILNADHIKPFAFFPELRFAIDNGRTLCEECHKKTNTYGGKIINLNLKQKDYAVL